MPRACFGFDAAEFNVTEKSSAAEAARESSNKLTITTYTGGNEGHVITFPDSTTMGIDCGTGIITTLSHYHDDHCSGNQQYNRDNVSLGQVIYTSADGAVTVTVVATNGRKIGDADGSCTSNDENACSMVLWVKYKGFDYLSGGDLTASPEDRLGSALAARGVKIDVLKVHHHGSSGSSSSSFLQNISPEYAVVSGHASNLKSDTLARLKNAGVKIIYDTYNDQNDPQFKYSGGDITISTNGSTYSFSAPNFNDGPFQVDEYVPPDVIPPHLLITEVALGTHQAPENHDWIELYLPLDASSIKLSDLYWTDLDEVQRAATSTVTIMPGDVVILHDAPGPSENDTTGKRSNGWWDIYVENPWSGTWNAYDDQFAICSQKSIKPAPETIIDAVVWSNDDGSMLADQVANGNYLIGAYHWGDPTAGSGSFSTTNEGPAVGNIRDGYAQRITKIDTNSKADWQISPTNSEGTPPPEPTPIPPPPPTPPLVELVLSSSNLAAGEMLTVSVVVQPVTGRPFDAYAVIAGKAGTFSIQSGNHLRRWIIPIVRDIPALPQGYSGVLLNMTVPQGVSGDYRVVAGLVDAGGKVRGPASAFAYDVEHLSVK
ncbi:MAG: hypothetical protein NTX71_05080 [Candidatus Aureabacteria bacterium]|nr:hypothetical protein [Candidatus Auribacterota bacterium]